MKDDAGSGGPELVYYVAQTLDGFIAERDGGVAFLDVLAAGADEGPGDDHGYHAFYAGVDALILGRATYAFVEAAGVWHYAGKPAWVMISSPVDAPPADVRVHAGSPDEVLAEVRAAGCRRTWLVGGGRLAAAFADRVDEWIVTVVPYLMGDGIPLVATGFEPRALTLVRHTVFPSGAVQLTYRPRTA